MNWLPYGRHSIGPSDLAAVAAVLESDALTQGPMVERFEEALATFVGARHAVVFNSGTAALHAAYAVAGVGPGNRVLTSPITFVADQNAARYLGAGVAFADVDPRSALLDLASVAAVQDTDIRAVVPVHFGGEVANLPALARLAGERGWVVIEDAAHALGATYTTPDGAEHRVGACVHSTMACFSFHPVKHITTGEGGAVTTNDATLAKRLRRFRTHGITRAAEEIEHSDGPWYYEQHDLGFNYRLTDIQCALGLSQLAQLPQWVAARRRVGAHYRSLLAEHHSIQPLEVPSWSRGSYHLFVVSVPGARRRQCFEELRRHGIGANVHYIPVYRQPYYRRNGFADASRVGAETYYAGALTLPMMPRMTCDDAARVVQVLARALGDS